MLKLFNTLTREKEAFRPLKKTVSLYNCGPTVYHDQHIGNFRTSLSVDLLKRTLLYFGYPVKHITNITDVGHLTNDADDSGEDKIEVGARREGLTARQVARKYEKQYKQGIKSLGIIPPFKWTRATEHIAEQIALIKKLEKKGYTYRTEDGIYFDATKFKNYGKLAGLSAMKRRPGIRVNLGEKKHATDFALWKFAAAGTARQMEWESPWGIGFPGWHIECSAMAMKYLGETIDIHCGAIDLIPVHHTNEIAQSEAATGKPFVRHWMHGAFVIEGKEKMAKSVGNIKTLEWIEEQGCSPLDYRYLTLQTHYRKELRVTAEALVAARTARAHLIAMVSSASPGGALIPEKIKKFEETLLDDLNAPRGLAVLWEVVNAPYNSADKRATILAFDAVLGLGLKPTGRVSTKKELAIPDAVKKILGSREQSRQEKNWKRSDELRTALHAAGFDVLDTAEGQKLKPVV